MTTKGSGIVRGIGYLINMGYRFDGGVAALPDGSKCDVCGSTKDLTFALPEKTSRLPQVGVVLCKKCLDKIVYDQILEMAYLYCQVCKEQTAHEPWDNGYYVCHDCKTQSIARWRP